MTQKKFWIELLSSSVILLAVNFIFFRDDLGFLKFNQHPFWIPILLMGALYGVRAAFISSLFFSILYFGLFSYQYREALETYFDFKILKQPLLFIGFGSLLGKMTQTVKDNLAEWKTKFDRTKLNLEKTEKELETISTVKADLERRVVSQLSTMSSVYDYAKTLESLDPRELYSSTLKTLIEHLSIDQVSFYVADHNLLLLKATEYSGTLRQSQPKEIHKTHGLFHLAITQRKTLTIRDASLELDFQTLKESPMIIAPLFRKDTSLLGVITVDKIDFKQFTPTTIKQLGIMVEWLATAIDHALYFEEIKSKNILDETLGIYHHVYFKTRLEDEFTRSKTYALPVSVLLLSIQDFNDIKKESKLALLQSLITIIKGSIRSIDLVAQYSKDDMWAILFPTCPEKEAIKYKELIDKKISEFEFNPFPDKKLLTIKYAIGSFHPKIQSADALLSEAEKNLEKP